MGHMRFIAIDGPQQDAREHLTKECEQHRIERGSKLSDYTSTAETDLRRDQRAVHSVDRRWHSQPRRMSVEAIGLSSTQA